MGSNKCALVELDLAGLASERYAEFEIKLDKAFGRNWWNGQHGIYVNGVLVLARSAYREFLDGPKEVTVDVGVMEVTVEAGPDKTLGTPDDKVTMQPKRKGKADKKSAVKQVKAATPKKPPKKGKK